MAISKVPAWQSVHTIVFDFDGIFTNNKVWVDQDGIETVRCDRADGLGLDLLRKFTTLHKWDLNYFILSKEKNAVVSARASKLNIRCVHGISDKKQYLKNYLLESDFEFEGLIYLGNDLNDLPSMILAGFSVAPCDAHPAILDITDYVLTQKGGEGCVREFIEALLNVPSMSKNEIEILLT